VCEKVGSQWLLAVKLVMVVSVNF